MDDEASGLWRSIADQLRAAGVDIETMTAKTGEGCKVVCVAANLGQSVAALGDTPRDQVVMVRVDAETVRRLDAWVEAGAVKSRSEAAALFIREGLTVRERELEELQDALQSVDEAKARLRAKARRVLGNKGSDGE